MSFAFKKFNFLQHTEVSQHAFPRNSTSCATSSKHLYVGCDNGSVAVLDPAFQLITSFQAHAVKVFFVAYLEERNLLLTAGSEEPGYSSTHLKVWDVPRTVAARAPTPTPAPAQTTGLLTGPSAGSSSGGGSTTAAATSTHQPVKLIKVFSAKYPEAEITALSALEIVPQPPAPSGAGSSLIPSTMMLGAGSTATTVVVPGGYRETTGPGGVLAVALGLATGMVYVILLDLPHLPGADGVKSGSGALKPLGAPVTASKPISVTKLSARPEAGHAWAVTGLALHGSDLESLSLFVVTESQTLSFNLKTHIKSVLDAQGAPSSGCTVLKKPPGNRPAGGATPGQQHPTQQAAQSAAQTDDLLPLPSTAAQPTLVVARDEGLYNYTPDTRAGCTVLEGSKQRLLMLGRFVVVVTQEKSEVGTSSATILIMDLPHKLISGSLTVHSVSAVISWLCDAPTASTNQLSDSSAASQKPLLVAVTGSNKLYTFREVYLAMQLEALFKRSLHKLALDLARVQHADENTIANIQQRWGDALYSKGEFDAAMVQYSQTIGLLEPSYVIRRFLDAQRIHNLTGYLELLHDKGQAGADHTTLLLNCYTKLKDVEKLDAFIQRSVVQRGAGAPAGSTEPSTQTAAQPTEKTAADNGAAGGKKKKGRKRGSVGAALAGLQGGDVAAAATAPSVGSPADVAAAPAGPELKFDAETAVKVLRAAGYARHALTVAQAAGNPDWQLDILLEDCAAWDEALQVMGRLPRRQCAAALRRVGKVLVTHRPEPTTSLIMDLCAPATTTDGDGYAGSVADFAHLFCDAPTGLMLLCEFILASATPGTIADERMLHHTLLELYLADKLDSHVQGASTAAGIEGGGATSSAGVVGDAQQAETAAAAHEADKKVRRGKALELLKSGWPAHLEEPKYDQEHALVLCRLAGFKEGLVLLYDRLRLYREVMQVHMEGGDVEALVATAITAGDASRGGDPQLWAMLLEYLAQQPAAAVEKVVVEVVEQIEARRILPPIMVLQLLASNTQLKVSSLSEYISRHLSRESSETSRDREAATRLAAESAALRAELARLKSQARVFQASRCSATGMPLELPAIHFMCGHAYNARALGDNDKECPLCAPDYRRVVEIRRNMATSALQQDRFFSELRESADGFGVVAEHFGRGLMNMTAASLNIDSGAGGGLMGLAAMLAPPNI